MLNVAEPLEPVFVKVLPLAKEPLLKVSVIGTLLEAILLPAAFWICTTTLAMVEPAVVFAGCVVNASWVAFKFAL